jgi:hypothetical protein
LRYTDELSIELYLESSSNPLGGDFQNCCRANRGGDGHEQFQHKQDLFGDFESHVFDDFLFLVSSVVGGDFRLSAKLCNVYRRCVYCWLFPQFN